MTVLQWLSSEVSGRYAVQVLATLFLLSYAKLLQLTITIFSSTTLEYPDGSVRRVWLYYIMEMLTIYLKGKQTHSTVHGFSASTSGPLPTLHSSALVYPVPSTEIKIQSSVLDWEIQTSL